MEFYDGQTVNMLIKLEFKFTVKQLLILLCKPQICWLWLTIPCATVTAHRSMFVYIYEVRVVTGKHRKHTRGYV